ncbi:serine-threonine protein kinase [Streptomyces sp. NBC_01381]|uniref:serine-threonine protein kinase n=1 Tax=Streptomyces sp. NBC_01381 TaxID=2903845 RepID=UPI002254C32D|nr:serine-threonine protein kinase [Streptomyces sp. NBC_01381]MCX4668385.1 serine-threonine protein kinase [Streptomyces sp. NBC_01381]
MEPYWELTFDADGDADTAQRDRLIAGVARERVTDLLVLAHGWNNDQDMATDLYRRFFAPCQGLAGTGVRLGYVGVIWPAIRFPDEPIPDFERSAAAAAGAGAGPLLDEPTRRLLAATFPGHDDELERIGALLAERSGVASRLYEYGRHVRDLVSVHENSPARRFADDIWSGEPAMLTDDAVEVCELFAAAMEGTGQQELFGSLRKRLWNGAHELLRQASYYAMKRRAGTVGQLGLGPTVGLLVGDAPALRVHLIGHSFGARLVSYALRGMPESVRGVKSTTLLQGAFSHYAFSGRLPHDPRRAGALHGVQRRIDGPLVSCYSRHDDALGKIYPLASKIAGDSSTFLGLWERWGAIGYNGIRAVDGAKRIKLGRAIPAKGCVSVDAAAVVRRGGPPAGAHSDICHEELARVVFAAGRIALA